MIYDHKDSEGNTLILNGRYVTAFGICRRITKNSIVQIQCLQNETHAYVYGENGGSGYIRPDQLTKLEK